MSKVLLKLRPRITLEADTEGAGGMLFDTQTAAICACNASAWVVVQALQAGSHADALTTLLFDAFDVERAVARKDVLALVKELRSLDMLEPQ